MTSRKNKQWGGRFADSTAQEVMNFTASVSYDQVLAQYDIAGSVAHGRMLHEIGILTDDEAKDIDDGLAKILNEVDSGEFVWSEELEDVHMNIEARLTELIGDAGRKLHTGRSRNDQVATDLRMYTRDYIEEIIHEILELKSTLVDFSEREASTLMPGYTHLQVAQPITFGHHLMAWYEMLERDGQRFIDALKRVNVSPLGAAALAGTTIPIDRQLTCELLDFDDVCQNSLDAVSDRDFAIETASVCALTMVHLSRFAEEIIIWASDSYKFISLSDAYATGSSIMPQKKNPDVAELIRGRSARVSGQLQSLLMLMKGQPLAYNRDNQEDKIALFDCLETTFYSIKIMNGMIQEMEPQRERMLQAASEGFSTATDLAEGLAKKNVPFRTAHEVVGQIVRHCIETDSRLEELSLETLQSFAPEIDESIKADLNPAIAVTARNHIGGTAPEQVKKAVKKARQRLKRSRKLILRTNKK